jgi:hypothetical protein
MSRLRIALALIALGSGAAVGIKSGLSRKKELREERYKQELTRIVNDISQEAAVTRGYIPDALRIINSQGIKINESVVLGLGRLTLHLKKDELISSVISGKIGNYGIPVLETITSHDRQIDGNINRVDIKYTTLHPSIQLTIVYKLTQPGFIPRYQHEYTNLMKLLAQGRVAELAAMFVMPGRNKARETLGYI